MKGMNLLKVAGVAALGIFTGDAAYAQQPRKENIGSNLGGTRFLITAPSSIVGAKKIKYADWGKTASPTLTDIAIEKAYDTLGSASALLNGTGSYPALTGKFALIYRGGNTFSDKVNKCISKGAIGVIIVNNVPGDPVGMGATPVGSTVGVPVLMVSDVDGQAISDVIKSSPAGTAKLTLGTWNTGGTHDLGVMANYQATPHALNIPLHQLTGSAGTEAYKHYIGGAVANYGSTTETGIKVTDSVYWIPSTATTGTFITDHEYSIASISELDSIGFGFGTGSYELAPPTSTGKYEHRYSIDYGETDDFPQDNLGKLTQNITDSIFCKGSYDHVNGRPGVSLSIRSGDSNPFLMGNMFFVKNGGYAARKIQFSLTHDVNPTLEGFTSGAYIMKWTDGVGAAAVKDSVVQASELTVLGYAGKVFTNMDSVGKTLTLNVENTTGTTDAIILESDSWYYIAVDVPSPLFLGVDESASFYSRSFAQFKNAGSKLRSPIFESPAGLAFDASGVADYGRFQADGLNQAGAFPFSGHAFFIDSSFYDRFNEMSAIALHMSKNVVTGVKDVVKNIGSTTVYPNPATKGVITVDVALAQKSNKVAYRITDMIGRTLYSEIHENVLNERFNMNTAQYVSGNYFLMIITDHGIVNKEITIQN